MSNRVIFLCKEWIMTAFPITLATASVLARIFEAGTSGNPAGPKVPMRRRGADCLVVAMKRVMPAERSGQVIGVGKEPTVKGRSSKSQRKEVVPVV